MDIEQVSKLFDPQFHPPDVLASSDLPPYALACFLFVFFAGVDIYVVIDVFLQSWAEARLLFAKGAGMGQEQPCAR